jgi:hypothetical protein
MPSPFCARCLAQETAPRRYCSVHARLYVRTHGHWYTAPPVPGVLEGACDRCQSEAHDGLRPPCPGLDAQCPTARAWHIFIEECVL